MMNTTIHELRFCRSTTAVSVKAREVLIAAQLPSYEERTTQMEQVLKASVSGTFYCEPSASGIRYVIADNVGVAY